ncbi:Microtubule-binding protein MIP-T3 CH-like domain [Popillia japonica]|uniref:TRAF3-interacting protein 1 n=1 Tax=Popillia japonica TaxID=7064 RepID=A0AAW1JXW7_POPJA
MSEDIKLEIIEKTQKVLGKHISKPVLSEKLLRKPPFRFLHDIVTSVIKDTGFLKGMYTESELISDNVKERDLKITFLTKLIDAIKILTEIDLKVKPTKVIAGLEPSETNKLLQAIGYALDKKIDSSEYIKKISIKSKVPDKSKKNSKTVVQEDDQKDSHRYKRRESEVTKPEKTKKKGNGSSRDNNSVEKLSKTKKEKNKKENKKDALSSNSTINDNKTKKSNTNYTNETTVQKGIDSKDMENLSKVDATNEQCSKKEINDQETFSNTATSTDESSIVTSRNTEEKQKIEEEPLLKQNPQTTDVVLQEKEVNLKGNVRQEVQKPKMERPKSARPQSGDLKKSGTAKMMNTGETAVNQKVNTPARPMSSLRPPSVRPSSARPGAPRLRPDSSFPLSEILPLGKINVIIENYNTKDVDEEETVVIHSTELEVEPIQKLLEIPEDKGHLVEQILEQIHDEDVAVHVKSKNEIDWEIKGFHNKDTINREISQVRSQIQSLTKVANPLGKLMNYLHEDVESMLSELNMWINMKRDVTNEIAKQKKNNEDSSKPLMLHLQELDDNINKQEAEIVVIRSNILKNDLRIKDLLTK